MRNFNLHTSLSLSAEIMRMDCNDMGGYKGKTTEIKPFFVIFFYVGPC